MSLGSSCSIQRMANSPGSVSLFHVADSRKTSSDLQPRSRWEIPGSVQPARGHVAGTAKSTRNIATNVMDMNIHSTNKSEPE